MSRLLARHPRIIQRHNIPRRSRDTCMTSPIIQTPRKQKSRKEVKIERATIKNSDGTEYIDPNLLEDVDGTADYFFTHPGSDEDTPDGSLRKVRPYWYEYSTFAKGRWLNRTIYQVFSEEFRDKSPTYYEYAIKVGLITVNKKVVPLDTIIHNGDLVSNKIHRHEPPVVSMEPKIVYRDEHMCAVDKPGSIPVHPVGRYRHNSLIHILQKKHGVKFYPVNRIDRLTSGLVLMALTQERSRILEAEMRARSIRKEYVCRVVGEFPLGDIECNEPILTVSHKAGLNAVHPNGKDCKTRFKRLSYNGKTSVVHCFPLTGRTHQIRVHLQYLGHPIDNDPLYNNQYVFGNMLGKGGFLHTEPGERAFLLQDEEGGKAMVDRLLALGTGEEDWSRFIDAARTGQPIKSAGLDEDRVCRDCQVRIPFDPEAHRLYIWLHAWKYRGDGWAFETDLPDWAHEDFAGDR